MFGLSWGQITIIVLVGLFLLGPERIPTAVQWVTGTLRKVRTMAAGAQEQLRGEIGGELAEMRKQIAELQSLKELQELRALKDLNPQNLIRKAILGDNATGGVAGLLGLDNDPLAPVTGTGVAENPSAAAAPVAAPAEGSAPATLAGEVALTKQTDSAETVPARTPTPFDEDAT